MIRGVILDLDGTVYLGKEVIPGAPEFVAHLKEQGIPHLFVTNRSNRKPEVIRDQLVDLGIPCTVDEILTSAQATVAYVGEGSAYVVGEDGLIAEVEKGGITLTDDHPDWVIVSFDRQFNYDKLKVACRCIDEGGRFIATNPDKGLRVERGISPGTGAIVAAVEAGCGVSPTVIGKPERLIMDMALERLDLPARDVLAIGDNIDTDILAAHRAGLPSMLILEGISHEADVERAEVKPTWVIASYAELMSRLPEIME
jgi:4-nitrophenyl phosphatase